MTRRDIFRVEALDAQHARLFGRAMRARPMTFRVVAALVAGSTLAVAFLLMFATYSRKETIRGVLVPEGGIVQITSPISGTVSNLAAREGLLMDKGQFVAVVTSKRVIEGSGDASLLQLDLLESEKQSHLRQIERTKTMSRESMAAVRQRLELLRVSQRELEEEAIVQGKRLSLARSTMRVYEDLQEKGFLSEMQVLPKRDEFLQAQSRINAMARERASLSGDLTRLTDELTTLQRSQERDIAELQRSVSVVEQKVVELKGRTLSQIVMPVAGTPLSLRAEIGSSVAEGDVILSVEPLGAKLQALVYASSRAVGGIKPGQRVVLRYAAFPHQQYGYQYGKVLAVSGPVQSKDRLAAKSGDESRFAVTVEIPTAAIDQKWRLKAGMDVEADILLERRKLIEWLLDPLLRLRQPAEA